MPKHLFTKDDVGRTYVYRTNPDPTPPTLGNRIMDWLMTLTPAQFYILVTAGVMSAGILLFTVVWTWVMF